MARQPMTLSPAAPRSTRGRPARTQVPAPMRRTRRGRGRCAAPACALCRRANSYLVVSPPTWVIATGIVTVLVFILAAVLSSPDVPPVSLATWGRLAPADFMGTAVSELNGTGETAMYGPPYNNGTASVQRIGISWQQLAGVRIPIDTATDFVLDPLTREAPTDPVLARALDSYLAAPAHTPSAWEGAYLKALDHVTFHNGAPVVPAAPDGPAPHDDRDRAVPGPQRGAGRQPDRQPGLLRHELHPASAISGARPVLRSTGHRPTPHREPVGGMIPEIVRSRAVVVWRNLEPRREEPPGGPTPFELNSQVCPTFGPNSLCLLLAE